MQVSPRALDSVESFSLPSAMDSSMQNPSYTTVALDNGAVQIRTSPTSSLGPMGLSVFGCLLLPSVMVAIFFRSGFTVLATGALITAFYFYIFKSGEHNRGRKECTFRVDRGGITLESGFRIDGLDIARLDYSTPSTDPLMIDRSWQVVAEAKGRVHTLCGGLTESVARAVLHEIRKVLH